MQNINNLAGGHLIMDVLVRDINKINKEQDTKDYLDKVTEIIGLTQITPSYVFKFPFSGEAQRLIEKLNNDDYCSKSDIVKQAVSYLSDLKKNKCGVSGMTIFAESHASCHSWTQKKINGSAGGITIDVFSCNTLDAQQVIDFTAEHYSALQIDGIYIERNFGEPQKIKQYSWKYENEFEKLEEKIGAQLCT